MLGAVPEVAFRKRVCARAFVWGGKRGDRLLFLLYLFQIGCCICCCCGAALCVFVPSHPGRAEDGPRHRGQQDQQLPQLVRRVAQAELAAQPKPR